MRLVLMGTGPFALPAFDALMQSGHDVLAVVTRPVPPPTARRKDAANPVRDRFLPTAVPLLEPPNVNDSQVVEQLAGFAADLFVVCDYGQILSPQALRATRCGGVNLHGSLLPKYRGAAPINWALWNGEEETGVTVIHMTPRLDAGPCLVQARLAIHPQEDAVQLEQRLAQLGVEPILEALEMLEQWDGHSSLGQRQDPEQATKAPRLKKSDGLVDWSQPAQRIVDQVRALQPWPGTYTHWQRRKGPVRLILQQVAVATQVTRPADAVAGQILASSEDLLVVAAGTEAVAIQQLQPAGKRVLNAREFLRGYPLSGDDRWG